MEKSLGEKKDRNFYTHIVSLSLTKLSDGLLDPKIVLSWLLATLGASAFSVGLLVPIREAGALLPQLLIAEPIRKMPVRKWAWIVGSVIQGASAAGIALAALFLEPTKAGIVIVVLVGVLATARSVSSVSYKDVLGKTVPKSLRGQSAGTAASVAAVGVFVFGFLLLFDVVDRFTLVISGLLLAGILWVIAAGIFSTLTEEPTQPQPAHTGGLWRTYWHYLTHDTELQKLIVARALLLASAIAPPYLILLAGEAAGGVFRALGALVIASSLASLVSGHIWGIFSDRSTARVLMYAGLMAGTTLGGAVVLSTLGYFSQVLIVASVLFLLMVAYQGVRVGRATHLVNIADEHTRTGYTALSNTIIGIALLFSGALGLLVPAYGASIVVAILAVMCVLGAVVSMKMSD